MRSLTFILLLPLVACSRQVEGQNSAVMQQIEERVRLPAGAAKLTNYARYYAMDGRRVVGTYITDVDPANKYYDLPVGQRRWIEDHRNLPSILDGGCSVVSIVYDPVTQKVETASCNGDA